MATSRTTKKKYLSPLDAVEVPAYQPPMRKSVVTNQDESVDEPSTAPQVSTYVPATNSAISDTGIAGQWVELGSFASAQEAWNHWKMLQQNVAELAAMRSAISGTLSGNGGSKYQLRAGSFTTDVEAESACKAVVKQGNKCSVASPF
jgi:hypothetical protein